MAFSPFLCPTEGIPPPLKKHGPPTSPGRDTELVEEGGLTPLGTVAEKPVLCLFIFCPQSYSPSE